MPKRGPIVIAVTLCATAVLAHQGVQNPAVKTRMDAMSAIGVQMKVLGDMAKGKTTFDANAAQLAASGIADHAAKVPALFEAPETDPKSEALPAIWDNFGDFTRISADLEAAATQAASSMATAGDLAQAMATIGATCSACHKSYRK